MEGVEFTIIRNGVYFRKVYDHDKPALATLNFVH
jgi:hypothetical protein